MVRYIVDNFDGKDYVANEKYTTHNLKNAEKFLLNIFTKDISLDRAKNLYKDQALLQRTKHYCFKKITRQG